MKYYTNQFDVGSDFSAVGNGKVRASIKGPDIWTLRSYYKDSPVISLSVEQFSALYAVSEFMDSSSIHMTKISRGVDPLGNTEYSEAAYDALLYDYPLPERNVFIRSFYTLKKVSFKLTVTSDAEAFHYPKYKVDSVQRNCIMISNNDIRLYIMLCGSCDYIEATRTIELNRGYGSLIFSFGPPDMALRQLTNCVSDISTFAIYPSEIRSALIRDTKEYYQEIFGKIKDKYYNTELYTIALSCAQSLTALQSPNGCIASDFSSDICDARTQYVSALALKELGLNHQLRRICEFYYDVYQRDNKISYAYNSDGTVSNIISCDKSSYYLSYVILTVLTYLESIGYAEKEKYKELLYYSAKAMTEDMNSFSLSFCGLEDEFRYDILHKGITAQGSIVSDLLYIDAISRLTTVYSDIPKDITDAYLLSRKSFRKHYTSNQTIYHNYPLREASVRHPRFRHAYCDYCDISNKISLKERNNANFYCCPSCLTRKDIPYDITQRYVSLKSVCLAVLLNFGAYSSEEESFFLEKYLSEYSNELFACSYDNCDMLFSSDLALLLLALEKTSDPKKIYQRILELISRDGFVPHYTRGNKTVESGWTCADQALIFSALTYVKQKRGY